MEITEVRVKLMEDSDDRLRAFCSITFDDCFVIRDLKVIDGVSGPFVAMPSRKLTSHCPSCGGKNHLRSVFCNQCGARLPQEQPPRESDGRVKLYADIAHPVNSDCREMIQQRVIAEYEQERERACQPGYVSRYDDEYQDEEEEGFDTFDQPASGSAAGSRSQIQPAEETPPPPHQPPAAAQARWGGKRQSEDAFGAGIFDD